MSDFFVSIDNEEINEEANNLSLTGTVNGVNCATVIRLTSLKGLKGNALKRAKQLALINAFGSRLERKVVSAEKVSL